ncbi:multidrug resistance-associated protein 5 [Tanacetum coccineum]|uniref:Multidrug resistance-associated protein 5 n=1 Tax=Tanacetum coccineum TaxID=301880 RepID=A0ABQ4ZV11_9ASTR
MQRCTVEVDSETEYESDDDSDYQSDKSVDYLSPGEDELIELRNRMKANRKAKAKAKDKPDEELNEPNKENSMPADNVRGETFEEHDIYMNELLKSLKTADKDGITEDPFISVEKHVERSREVRVVAKYGQRPPRVYDPEKGKQRKQTMYPCASSDELPKCPWRCYARWTTDEKTFQCISLNDEHTCVKDFNFGALVNYKWIAKLFSDKIKANQDIRLCAIADLVMKKYKCKVNLNQCTNAKKYALTEYEKSIDEHYSMLRSYGKAILDSNPWSTVKLGVTVNLDGKTYFDRFYVCFVGLVDGWKAGRRKIIALDGCFLKSPNQGEILTAIGRDGNNHIYPVAWAVVNVDNKDNWTWFLELLEEDLGCSRGNGLTLMSDQHKGLIEAVKDVMPNAELRQCARHIYENFRKQYPGLEYRQLFWATSKASYPQLFNKFMDKIKSANPNTHKYLMDKNPKTWSRAFFEVNRGCEAIENDFRSKGFIVDKGKRTCSCRMWQLSGLPCVHGTMVIFLINRILESYVPAWFKTYMYFVAYHNYIKPVPDMNFWPDQSMYSIVLPPKLRKMLGRPRKKRIRTIGEGGSSTRVSKVVSYRSCSNCKKPGHNKSICKKPVVEQTPKPKGVVGRPRKKQLVDDFEEVDVVQRGLLRDEGASGTRGGRGAGGSGGASGSIGRGAGGSRGRGAGGSKRKPVSTVGTQKRQGKKMTQHEPEQTQVEDQVEQTEDQAEIDLTQLEQTQEPTQDQVQEPTQEPQEQPQQAALRMPSARIFQRKLGKQGSIFSILTLCVMTINPPSRLVFPPFSGCDIPCAHELLFYDIHGQSISIKCVDIFWRTLDVSWPVTSEDGLNCQNDGLRFRVSAVHKNTRGRSSEKEKKKQTNQFVPPTADPHRQQTSQFVPPVVDPHRRSYSKPTKVSGLNQETERHSSYVRQPTLSNNLTDYIPEILRRHIFHINNVEGDGNRRFRSVGVDINLGENMWSAIRQNLLQALDHDEILFTKMWLNNGF